MNESSVEKLREELQEIKYASKRMIEHIDFVEKHIMWIQRLVSAFIPKVTNFFKIEKNSIDFYDVV